MTTIRDIFAPGDYVSIEPQKYSDATQVRVMVYQGYDFSVGVVDRAEFLAAVAAELDVVVFDAADLPPVEDGDGGIRVCTSDGTLWWNPVGIRFAGGDSEKNPPVDEAQVDALVELISGLDLNLGGSTRTYARRLVQAGVRPPEQEKGTTR